VGIVTSFFLRIVSVPPNVDAECVGYRRTSGNEARIIRQMGVNPAALIGSIAE
jgi:hypothetical protein